MILGFTDSIKDRVEDDRALLSKYGPMLNELLQSRAHVAVDAEKRKGLQFIHKYLTENPKAINTESGLVYNEIVAGLGKQVCSNKRQPYSASRIVYRTQPLLRLY